MTNVMGVQYHGTPQMARGMNFGGGGGGGGNTFQAMAQISDRIMANMQDRRRKKLVNKFMNKPNLTERDIQAWAQIDPDGVEMYLGVKSSLQKIGQAQNEEQRTQADWEFNMNVGALTYMNRGLRAISKVPEAQREAAATSMLTNLLQSGDPMKVEAAKNWVALHFDATTGRPDFSDMRIESGIEYTTGMEHRFQLDEKQMERDLQKEMAQIEAQSRLDVTRQQGANELANIAAKGDQTIRINEAERQAEAKLRQQMGGQVGMGVEEYEPADQVQLAKWAIEEFKKGTFETIDDALKFSRSLQSGAEEDLDYGGSLDNPPGGDVASRDDFVGEMVGKLGGDQQSAPAAAPAAPAPAAPAAPAPAAPAKAEPIEWGQGSGDKMRRELKDLDSRMTKDGLSSAEKKEKLKAISEAIIAEGDDAKKKKGRWTYFMDRSGKIIYKYKN